MVGPGAHAQMLHDCLEQRFVRCIHRTELAHLGRTHVGVALQRRAAVSSRTCKFTFTVACLLDQSPLNRTQNWRGSSQVGRSHSFSVGHVQRFLCTMA